jgi:uncharacterized protein
MTELVVGIKHIRDGVEPRPIIQSDMSVVGIVGSAPAANADTFPLNTPVYMASDDTILRGLLGATGTIPDAIRGVHGQLVQSAAKLVIVRIDPGADAAAAIAAVVGSSASKTGIWALTDSAADLGVTPRIILCPGYTSQQAQGVTSVAVTTPGTGYTSAPTVAFSGGGGSGAAATAIVSGGAIIGVTVTNPGTGYTSAPTVAFSGGAGTGGAATASSGVIANAVVTALAPVLERLKGVAIVQGPTSSRQAWIDWRETIQSHRIIPGSANDVLVLEGTSILTRPADSRIAGALVRRDSETDGRPFRSAANQPIYDIVGVSRTVEFSLSDDSVEGQDIAFRNGGFIVKGESGVESALSEGGFVYWGTDTCSEDALWQFYNVVRGRDYIELAQTRALRFYLGRFNITYATVDAILNTLDLELARLAANGDILDYRLGFERDKNTPEELRLGKLWITFKAEEPPVLRKITISSQRYRAALETLSVRIAAQIDALVA